MRTFLGILEIQSALWFIIYRKIPIINPRPIFAQTALLLGLFSGEVIFGGAYYWREFCVSKWVGLTIKTVNSNSPWAYIRESLLSERYLRPRFERLIFGRAYFCEGL